MTGRPTAIPVIHSVDCWLGRTLAWLHPLVTRTAADIAAHVACGQLANVDEFPVARLHCYAAGRTPIEQWLCAHSWRYRLLRKRALLRAIARDADSVIVHSHFGTRGWLDLDDVRAIRARHVVSFYGFDVDRLPLTEPRWRERYRRMFATVDRVLCEGPKMLERVVALGCPDELVSLHRLGIDVASVPFQPRTWRAGEPLGVLLASTFFEKKGIPYAVEALARVRRHIPLRVTIAGDATAEARSQREKERILATVDRCAMRDVVALPGYVSQVQLMDLAARHHIFIAPSITASDGDTEGGAPMVLPLIAATGMLIVSTRHRDIPDVVEDGIGGKLANERDVEGLAEGIEWCAANAASWPAMAARARARIERDYNSTVQGACLAGIYRAIAKSTPPASRRGQG